MRKMAVASRPSLSRATTFTSSLPLKLRGASTSKLPVCGSKCTQGGRGALVACLASSVTTASDLECTKASAGMVTFAMPVPSTNWSVTPLFRLRPGGALSFTTVRKPELLVRMSPIGGAGARTITIGWDNADRAELNGGGGGLGGSGITTGSAACGVGGGGGGGGGGTGLGRSSSLVVLVSS